MTTISKDAVFNTTNHLNNGNKYIDIIHDLANNITIEHFPFLSDNNNKTHLLDGATIS